MEKTNDDINNNNCIATALGLLSVVGVTIVPIQEAETKGCPQPTFDNPEAPGYFNSGQKCFTIPNSH